MASSGPHCNYQEVITWDGDSLILTLYLQPNATVDEWFSVYAGALKVKINAPAVDGRANAALRCFLAQQFKVPKQRVLLEKGRHGRHKRICIVPPLQLPERLTTLLNENGIVPPYGRC